ncbi:MAG: single-stranded-DNA-specific exonuclease RecJ [Dehalococcoidia bacterium]|nr:single-stranded-DNA-specific exonuclease RecJ [Dehalococcoidia bacterium]NUQ54261.1 single-stranded-DNA-specific exonuclease RecJ [Dehalococcoidia bacterium]
MTTPSTQRPASRWRLRDPGAHLKGIAGFPAIVATVLAARGITTRAQAEIFYKPHLMPDSDPLQLPGMREAVARTREAIGTQETIALFGDFDVDGVTSVAVLHQGLQALGARTVNYIPDRFTEGYGLNKGAVSKLRQAGAGLMITADCGISSVEEVALANELGLDVIILDHHTVPAELPPALAAVNPKRLDSPYPFTELAAVGVAFRFLQVLYEDVGRSLPEDDYLDLVALGTVVDVAPLTSENRRIVAEGLERMRAGLRPGLEALARVSGAPPELFTAETLGFAIGPRMNAAGRIEHANIALELLLARDPISARGIAERLDHLNRLRQQQTEEACALAEASLGAADEPLIMVGSDQIHAGIVGLVASRLADRYHRPAIVYERGPETSRASARSIPAFDIVAAIRKEQSLLVRHGGHRAAAGFTVANENLDLLRDRLLGTAAEMLDGHNLQPVVAIDAEAPLSTLTGLDVKGLMRFEPCGQENRRPVLLSRGVQLVNARPVGSDQSHLKLAVRDGPATWPGIAFRQANAPLADRIDIVYSLSRDRGSERIELEVLDIAPAAERRPLELE